jgi:hypothetical protein
MRYRAPIPLWAGLAVLACTNPTGPHDAVQPPHRPAFKVIEDGSRSAGGHNTCTLGQTLRSGQCQWRAGASVGMTGLAALDCLRAGGSACAWGVGGATYGWNDWYNHEPTDLQPPMPSTPYHCLDCGMGDPYSGRGAP